jgi:hypothetical protein
MAVLTTSVGMDCTLTNSLASPEVEQQGRPESPLSRRPRSQRLRYHPSHFQSRRLLQMLRSQSLIDRVVLGEDIGFIKEGGRFGLSESISGGKTSCRSGDHLRPLRWLA